MEHLVHSGDQSQYATFMAAITLFGFRDVSTKAYAAVMYLRVGGIREQFVVSKTRVALTQEPRLQLLSALLLARLVTLKLLLHQFDLKC